MRTFKVVEADGKDYTFYGFDKDFSTPHVLALCQDEDTFDVWALDGLDLTNEIDDLLRFFDRHGSCQKLIGTYREEGFRGFTVAENYVSRVSRFK